MSKNIKIINFVFCAIKLTLHLIADYHSGFQGDELLHIETGNHLDFGFMEFPPMISFFAFFQNLFQSDSVFVHHIVPHLASILIMIFLSKTVIELGGKEKSVFLVLLAIIISPAFERSQQLFQPVVFSQLFWVLGFYFLLKFVKYLDQKNLNYLTAICILGFLTKYDSVFFIAGLSALVFFKRTRNTLIQLKFWKNILVFLVLILPNLLWQINHDFPIFKMFKRLEETQLEKILRFENFQFLLLAINPMNSVLFILPAIIFFFKKGKDNFKPIFFTILISYLLLLLSNGKSYYFFPIVLMLLPFGAVFWENFIFQKRKWAMIPVSVLLFLGLVLIPFGMPVYSFKKYVERIYPYEKTEIKGGKFGIKFEEYYTKEKWSKTLTELKKVYDSLPKNEQQNCLIWGKHYSQAGAINLFGKTSLPKAFSYHGSFYSWTPKGNFPETTIVLSYDIGNYFEDYFEEINLVKTIYNPYSENEEELYQKIYVCKKPKHTFDEMKQIFINRIFE